MEPAAGDRRIVTGVIFDTDGVITQTAAVHFAAWKTVFDPLLARLATGDAARPFVDADYRRYVDGIPRYDGVAALLASRRIDLPWGDPTDPPGSATICAVGNSKNDAFLVEIARNGVEPYRTTATFVRRCREAGLGVAAISASRNCRAVLEAAGVAELFDTTVDGEDAATLGLAGKPRPDVFVEAARRIGVAPEHAAIVEDAVAGVQAGREGGFGMVIGIDRTGHRLELTEHADLVITDVADLGVVGDGPTLERTATRRARLMDLPVALDHHDLVRRLAGRRVAVFLDYDGTLTPIVARPEDALLPPAALDALSALARVALVGVISGRDLDDVRSLVPAGGIWFAGSHGFDVESPTGERHQFEIGRQSLPSLDEAEAQLAGLIDRFEGAWVERKRFAIAVHHRASPLDVVPGLEDAVRGVAASYDSLRMTGGKKIFELRPAGDWDKGKALRWLMAAAGVEPADTVPIFIGDDDTDEDAFMTLRDDGVGVMTGREDRLTAAHYRVDDPDQVRLLLESLPRMISTP